MIRWASLLITEFDIRIFLSYYEFGSNLLVEVAVRPFDEVNDPDDKVIADWRGVIINKMRGMDADKVADEAHLARKTVQDFISGETICPTLRTFQRLSRAVNVRVALFEAGADPRTTHELRFTPKQEAFLLALRRKMAREKKKRP
jgi:DNA-binding phage protein